MSGDNKKSIRKQFLNVIVVIVVSMAACGFVAIASVLFLTNNALTESTIIIYVIIAAVISFAVIFSISYIHRVGRRIHEPIDMIEGAVRNVADSGSLYISESMEKALDRYTAEKNDEISSLIVSFRKMLYGLVQKVEILEKVALGDLRQKVIPASEEDSLSLALNDVVGNLSSIVRDVIQATEQLSIGANELSLGAQTLSQSSSEQSATMDQLHMTAAEIAKEAEENAGRAAEASKVTSAIRESAAEGSSKMLEMNKAIKEINKSSHAIGSVMKVIDEIAFQTNILALNAAVEAARAGVHGKGFAVVADEVRNLATKSGSAANDSNALIADTIVKSDMGNKIVDDAIEFFKTIEEGIANTSDLLGKIADAARNQSEAIDDINQGVTDMTAVVFQNSATSEQSAAASEQMSSQALILKETVKRFMIGDLTVPSEKKQHTFALGKKEPEKEPSSEMIDPVPNTIESLPITIDTSLNIVEPAPITIEPFPKAIDPVPKIVEPPHAATDPVPKTSEPPRSAADPVPKTSEPPHAATDPVPASIKPIQAPPLAFNPTRNPAAGGGRSPAEIYAEALK
jgi:methyl-accepting chemotaxis protein